MFGAAIDAARLRRTSTLHEIQYEAPATLDQALKLLGSLGENARPLCGGTDILIQMRAGTRRQQHLIDVKRIPELRQLSFDPKTGLRLGAAVPCIEVYENPAMHEHYPGLTEAAHLIGSLQIQNRASIGGNLCNGSPAADTTPALIVLGAVAESPAPRGRARSRSKTSCSRPDARCCNPASCWSSFSFPLRGLIRRTLICG